MQENIRSISFRDLKWENVDVFANKHGFKDRSPFVEYCVAKEVHKKKLGDLRLFEVIMILMMALLTISVLLLWLGAK